MEKTKKVLFGEILAIDEIQANEELVKFVKHEIELLEKKGSAKKPTKIQEENQKVKDTILDYLHNYEKPVSIKEFQSDYADMGAYSNQKVSALLKQLIAEKKVVRTEEKRVAMFMAIKEPVEETEEDTATE